MLAHQNYICRNVPIIKTSIREQMKVLMKFITNVKLRKIKLGSSIVVGISPSKGLCLLLLCGQNYNSLILSNSFKCYHHPSEVDNCCRQVVEIVVQTTKVFFSEISLMVHASQFQDSATFRGPFRLSTIVHSHKIQRNASNTPPQLSLQIL